MHFGLWRSSSSLSPETFCSGRVGITSTDLDERQGSGVDPFGQPAPDSDQPPEPDRRSLSRRAARSFDLDESSSQPADHGGGGDDDVRKTAWLRGVFVVEGSSSRAMASLICQRRGLWRLRRDVEPKKWPMTFSLD